MNKIYFEIIELLNGANSKDLRIILEFIRGIKGL